MSRRAPSTPKSERSFLGRNWSWMVLVLVLLLVLFVRVRLREMPLERDEGEYAYAGQLMLQGVPPYKLAYNLKLPGTYAAYALIMAVFGQTAAGIHIGLALVNAATSVLVYLLGRRMLDDVTGVVAGSVYALISSSPSFLGLAGHATHFVVLFAVSGALLLWRAMGQRKDRLFFVTGLLFGMAVLMKQHGLFIGLFFGIYVFWRWFVERNKPGRLSFSMVLSLAAGMVVPYLATCALMWAMGTFSAFWFWTFNYAREYASQVPLAWLHEILVFVSRETVWLNLPIWILAAAGALIMWWERRLRAELPFLLSMLLGGLAALTVGFQLRSHYFILLLPVLGVLAGVSVSRSIYLIRHDKSVELFLALGLMVVGVVGFGAVFVVNGTTWFAASPQEASQEIYRSSIFVETEVLGNYLRQHSQPEDQVAIIGSEPQISFYSRCRSATGFLYTYPLMERQRFAREMQDQMISEIEAAQPRFVVFVQDHFSWLQRDWSNPHIFEWWEAYWPSRYELIKVVNIVRPEFDELKPTPTPPGTGPAEVGKLMLLKKRES